MQIMNRQRYLKLIQEHIDSGSKIQRTFNSLQYIELIRIILSIRNPCIFSCIYIYIFVYFQFHFSIPLRLLQRSKSKKGQ